MVESPDEEMEASIVHNLRNKRSAAQKKRAKKENKQKGDASKVSPNAL